MAAPTPSFDPATPEYQAVVDHALMTTRGVRQRLDFERPVTDQVILDCIDVAEQAPTGGNIGSRRWMIIRDQKTKDRMAELYLSSGVDWVIKKADELKGTGHQNEKLMQGAKHLAENIASTPALVIPTIIGTHDGSGRPGLFDSVIQSAWSFMVALRARGLGSVWTTMYLNEKDAVADLLGLPDDVTQICLFPVAHTIGVDFKATGRRRPARDIAYFDRWGRTLAHERGDEPSLAAGPGVVAETDIKAPPEVVWDFVSDINLPARFSDEFQGAEWDGDVGAEGPGVGSTFTGKQDNPNMGKWETVSHVVAYEAPKEFAWHVGDPVESAARWRYTLEKIPGGTRLRYHCRYGPGPSGLTTVIAQMPDMTGRIIGSRQKQHGANMNSLLQGIKELAEAEAQKRREASGEKKSDFPGLGKKD